MALRPVKGRAVWARTPPMRTTIRIVPWQPASTKEAVGSPDTAASAAQQLGPVPPQVRPARSPVAATSSQA